MIAETKAKSVPVGFLDPEMMSVSALAFDRSFVVSHVAKIFGKFAKKKLIMFAHNSGGHWITVVIIPKFHKVLYFDSIRSKPLDLSSLKDVITE